MTFQDRLCSIMEQGNLTVADLARWLARPHATVSSWTNDGREPTGTSFDLKFLEAQIAKLEKLVKLKRGFPVPPLAQRERITYLEKLKNGR